MALQLLVYLSAGPAANFQSVLVDASPRCVAERPAPTLHLDKSLWVMSTSVTERPHSESNWLHQLRSQFPWRRHLSACLLFKRLAS
jgi:hypothetical protein